MFKDVSLYVDIDMDSDTDMHVYMYMYASVLYAVNSFFIERCANDQTLKIFKKMLGCTLKKEIIKQGNVQEL